MASLPARLLPVLQRCWSTKTSGQWLADNPARGQCNVTALVVQDFCGGDILKTKVPGGWHFYNRVEGERHDLTASQFAAAIHYADIVSSRAEALAGTEPERYATLEKAVNLLGCFSQILRKTYLLI